MSGLIDRINREAEIAGRPEQMNRLFGIADDVAEIEKLLADLRAAWDAQQAEIEKLRVVADALRWGVESADCWPPNDDPDALCESDDCWRCVSLRALAALGTAQESG